MTETIKLYKPNSCPLRELTQEELGVGVVGYTSYGDCFVVTYNSDDELKFEEVHSSELVDGECIENICKKKDLLYMFWTLSKKRYNLKTKNNGVH